MQRLRKLWKRTAVVMAVLIAGTVGFAAPAYAYSYVTYADIVCHDHGFNVKDVDYKGWGVDYAPNTYIHVDRIVTVNGNWYFSTSNNYWTSGSGSWSTSTGNHDASLMSGTFNLTVWVYRNSDGELKGTASDSCSM